jgi:two-component system chemotaxis response regulator CheB
MQSKSIIIIGASGGGPRAIHNIFTDLPPLAGSIIIIQQMPKYINASFCETLNNLSSMSVYLASEGMPLEEGCVYVAPSERHMKIQKNSSIHLFEGEKVNWACPSLDILMQSLLKETSLKVIGIILSGLGQDGAEGIKYIKQIGGYTITQDEASSAIYGMPKMALQTGQVDWQLNPEQIRNRLIHLVGKRDPS